jgi:hypothetical protein
MIVTEVFEYLIEESLGRYVITPQKRQRARINPNQQVAHHHTAVVIRTTGTAMLMFSL